MPDFLLMMQVLRCSKVATVQSSADTADTVRMLHLQSSKGGLCMLLALANANIVLRLRAGRRCSRASLLFEPKLLLAGL